MRRELVGLSLVICLVSVIIVERVFSQEEWRGVFSSGFCTVFYEDEVDMRRLNRRIRLGVSDFYDPRAFSKKQSFSEQDILSEKLDAIFRRVEDILDMRPPKIHVTIHIYKDKDSLDRAYEEIFKEPNTSVSFYIYKTNTIYTTQSDISERVLAHEMAHCVVDHYFVVLPPSKIQEMLAAYADLHLED